jgi:hypothetical protein
MNNASKMASSLGFQDSLLELCSSGFTLSRFASVFLMLSDILCHTFVTVLSRSCRSSGEGNIFSRNSRFCSSLRRAWRVLSRAQALCGANFFHDLSKNLLLLTGSAPGACCLRELREKMVNQNTSVLPGRSDSSLAKAEAGGSGKAAPWGLDSKCQQLKHFVYALDL